MEYHVLIAFGLTLFAGLSTGIGSCIAFFAKKSKVGFLSLGLGFSAGVMIYISFVEILRKSKESIAALSGAKFASWITVGGFFLGMVITALIDKVIPERENPHEVRSDHDLDLLKNKEASSDDVSSRSLMKTGIFTALAIAVHNFPEGLVTFFGALVDPVFGISIAVAIAIHNIPEGISVSVPIFYATNNRRKAFIYSFLSGLAEPIGALVGYFVLRPFLTDVVVGVLFSAVAGIMVYTSLDELLPTARKYGKGHTAILGLVLGMAVMALSLLLFL
ncbi:MAG: zinc transporter ZupT [Candidatus Aerophobetes bacterium]|nr:zinc transporter ZupT [Candidatus Aerophobetes bacterium]